MSEYITIKDASIILATSTQKIKKMIDMGILPAIDISTGSGKRHTYRLRAEDINNLVVVGKEQSK